MYHNICVEKYLPDNWQFTSVIQLAGNNNRAFKPYSTQLITIIN